MHRTSLTVRVDVRSLPTWQRSDRAAKLFARLGHDARLEITTNRDPMALRKALESTCHGGCLWTQLRRSEDEWLVILHRPPIAEDRTGRGAFFARCPLLYDASDATRALFAEHAISKVLTHGESLVEQGERWSFLGFVNSGTLGQTAISPSGREFLLFEISAHESFGELALVDNGAMVGRVVPLFGRVEIVAVPRHVVMAQMEVDCSFVRALSTQCGQRARELAERLKLLSQQSIVHRVAGMLLRYAPLRSGLAPALPPLMQMSQRQIGIAVGTVREVAARALIDLERAGMLEMQHGRVVRIDRSRLLAFLDRDDEHASAPLRSATAST